MQQSYDIQGCQLIFYLFRLQAFPLVLLNYMVIKATPQAARFKHFISVPDFYKLFPNNSVFINRIKLR